MFQDGAHTPIAHAFHAPPSTHFYALMGIPGDLLRGEKVQTRLVWVRNPITIPLMWGP